MQDIQVSEVFLIELEKHHTVKRETGAEELATEFKRLECVLLIWKAHFSISVGLAHCLGAFALTAVLSLCSFLWEAANFIRELGWPPGCRGSCFSSLLCPAAAPWPAWHYLLSFSVSLRSLLVTVCQAPKPSLMLASQPFFRPWHAPVSQGSSWDANPTREARRSVLCGRHRAVEETKAWGHPGSNPAQLTASYFPKGQFRDDDPWTGLFSW